MSLETSINALAVKLGQDYKTLNNNITTETTARIIGDTNLLNKIGTTGGVQSARDMTDVMITTSIPYVNDHPFTLSVTGNAYSSGLPFDLTICGYTYNGTIISISGISNGTLIPNVKAFSHNGLLCFHWPKIAYWQHFVVKVTEDNPAGNDSNTWNLVTNILNQAMPEASIKVIDLSGAVVTTWNSLNLDPVSKTLLNTSLSNLTTIVNAKVGKNDPSLLNIPYSTYKTPSEYGKGLTYRMLDKSGAGVSTYPENYLYASVVTEKPWEDDSGGLVIQKFTFPNGKQYTRTGSNTTNVWQALVPFDLNINYVPEGANNTIGYKRLFSLNSIGYSSSCIFAISGVSDSAVFSGIYSYQCTYPGWGKISQISGSKYAQIKLRLYGNSNGSSIVTANSNGPVADTGLNVSIIGYVGSDLKIESTVVLDNGTIVNYILADSFTSTVDPIAAAVGSEATVRYNNDVTLQTAINNLQSTLQANINAITNTLNGQSLVKADALGRNNYILDNTIITDWANTSPTIGKYNIYITTAQAGLPGGDWYYIEIDRHFNDTAVNGWKYLTAVNMTNWANTAGKTYTNIQRGNGWGGWICKEDLVDTKINTKQPKMYDGWNNQDANLLGGNKTNFTYANNAPYVGPIIHLGESGYDLQLNGQYDRTDLLAFRIKNGDNNTWNSWQSLVTGQRLLTTDSTNAISIDNINVNTIGYVGDVNNAIVSQPSPDGGVISTRNSNVWGSDTYIDFRTGQMSSRGKGNDAYVSGYTAWNEVQHRNMRMNGFALGQNLASYNSNNGVITGAVVITTNILASSNVMFDINIEGYDYSNTSGWSINVGGYTHAGNSWHNTGYSGINIPNASVGLAVNPSGYVCVVLGVIGDSWLYPKILVRNAKLGYQFSHNQLNNWTIGIDNSLGAYTAYHTVVPKGLNAQVASLASAVTNSGGVTNASVINALGYTPANTNDYLPINGSKSMTGFLSINGSQAGAAGWNQQLLLNAPSHAAITHPASGQQFGFHTNGYMYLSLNNGSSHIHKVVFDMTTGNISTASYGNLHDKFVAVDNTQQITGIKQFRQQFNAASSAQGVGGQYSLQATSTGNYSAGISFHKEGHYAVNMSLDADNVIRIGGWSAAADRLQLDMNGHLTLAGSVNAPDCTFGNTNNNGWYRSNGQCGWYSSSYGGGIWMIDTTYVRTFGGKQFYCDTNIIAAGQLQAGTNITAGGSITAQGNVTGYSDERLKKDWKDLDSNFINNLSKVKSGTFAKISNDERGAGVSAQSLRNVLPEAVFEDDKGVLHVAYGNAAMVATVELAKENIALKQRIDVLEKALLSIQSQLGIKS